MYAGLFFNLKQGFRERCRRRGEELQPLPASLPAHGSAGAEGSETLGVDRNLLSVFCCLFWGQSWAGAGAGAARGTRGALAPASTRCGFPSGKKVLVRLALSSAKPWFE